MKTVETLLGEVSKTGTRVTMMLLFGCVSVSTVEILGSSLVLLAGTSVKRLHVAWRPLKTRKHLCDAAEATDEKKLSERPGFAR